MNKNRVETLSDGVFAIAMTLLVVDFHVPPMPSFSDAALWQGLLSLRPVVESYFVSFTVLAMYWISHHALLHTFTKSINRAMVVFNMLFLSLIAFVPFSAHLLGAYGHSQVSVLFYGFNLVLISLSLIWMFLYALRSHEIDTSHVSNRTIKKAMIRIFLTPFCVLIGMAASIWSLGIALLLYAFPVIFNIFPGGLDFLERHFKLQLD